MKVVEIVYADIGKRIAILRIERGLSQAELGMRLTPPMTRANIGNIELGKQRLLTHVLLNIIEVLNCKIAEIVYPPKKVKSLKEQLLSEGLSESVANELTDLLEAGPSGEHLNGNKFS